MAVPGGAGEERLLPSVREFHRLEGEAALPVRLVAEGIDGRVIRAAQGWLDKLQHRNKSHIEETQFSISEEPGRLPHRDGYRLRIQRGIHLVGASPAGCFYGLQTLAQLARGRETIPCCEITDWPDFSTRGLLHDITRGKVPTLGTLKHLADRLATLKVNQLQLYIEHSFVFAFDPDIAGEENGLTPNEVRELDAYCRERFIDLVPAVATLGHMGRILSLPEYRHLAEIEPETSWEQMAWPQRARGFTLDVLNPESHALVEKIWTEILDAFSSPVVNICGDEPWDLGKGRNHGRIAAEKVGVAYIDHTLRTHAICAKRGRRVQVWSDVVRNHPELFDRLPRDLTVLHWGYDDQSDYEGTSRFVKAGLETIVCPGVSGWKRVLNAMDLAERNISTFAKSGKQHGASGLLNTDWGDHGHFNALACSWHGIALGAALGWRADHAISDDLDQRFVNWLFASQTTDDAKLYELVPLLRGASKIAERCETWRMLWQPVQQLVEDANRPSLADAEAAADCAGQASALLQSWPAGVDRDELVTACRTTELFRDKIHFAHGASLNANDIGERIESVREGFSQCWNKRYKVSGLTDIVTVFDRLRVELGLGASNCSR